MKNKKSRAESAGRDFEKTGVSRTWFLKHHTLSPFDHQSRRARLRRGGQVRLRVTAEGDQTPLELFLRVWNGAERRCPMRSLGVRNGKDGL